MSRFRRTVVHHDNRPSLVRARGPNFGGPVVAQPSLYLPFNTSGLSALAASIAFAGGTATPTYRYRGMDATATTWPAWTHGRNLDSGGSGTAPTLLWGTPLLDSISESVHINFGTFYHENTSDTYGALGSNDVFLEVFARRQVVGATQNLINTRATLGYIVRVLVGGNISFFVQTAGGSASTNSAALPLEGWFYATLMVNADEASTNGSGWCVNGAASGSGTDMSARFSDGVTNGQKFDIGGQVGNAGATYNGPIGYIALYLGGPALWSAGATGTSEHLALHKTRFYGLAGVLPTLSRGTANPSTIARASTAHLRKRESNGNSRLYLMASGWPRIESRADAASTVMTGYLRENAATNLIQQNQNIAAAVWTKFAASVTEATANSITYVASMDGIVANATSTVHYVEQKANVTADAYAISVYARKGDKNGILLWNTNVASCNVAFNLNTFTAGTKGAGVSFAEIENLGNGLARVQMVHAGTAGEHVYRIAPCADETDVSATFAGDGSTVNIHIDLPQLETGNVATSPIVTTTASATRVKDELQYNGDNAGIARGTVTAKVWASNVDSAEEQGILCLSNSTALAHVYLYASAGDQIQMDVSAAGSTSVSQASGVDLSVNTIRRVAAQWSNQRAVLSIDGEQKAVDLSCTPANAQPTKIDVAANSGAGNALGGLIGELKIYAQPVDRY